MPRRCPLLGVRGGRVWGHVYMRGVVPVVPSGGGYVMSGGRGGDGGSWSRELGRGGDAAYSAESPVPLSRVGQRTLLTAAAGRTSSGLGPARPVPIRLIIRQSNPPS